jgi:GNAT superfamily N-acetyltransferase
MRRLGETQVVNTIAALHAASWKVAYRGMFADHYLDADVDGNRRKYWRRRIGELRVDGGEIFLATVDGEAAGFLCIECATEPEWGAFVDNLHVLLPWQGFHIGGQLLARGATWAQEHGFEQMYLWVFEQNLQARRFYERDGWHVAGNEIHDTPDGGRLNAFRLIKKL